MNLPTLQLESNSMGDSQRDMGYCNIRAPDAEGNS